MMSRHFALSSEPSGTIVKGHPQDKISFLRMAVSSINSLDIYIYTAWTKVFVHPIIPHTNSYNTDLFSESRYLIGKRYT